MIYWVFVVATLNLLLGFSWGLYHRRTTATKNATSSSTGLETAPEPNVPVLASAPQAAVVEPAAAEPEPPAQIERVIAEPEAPEPADDQQRQQLVAAVTPLTDLKVLGHREKLLDLEDQAREAKKLADVANELVAHCSAWPQKLNAAAHKLNENLAELEGHAELAERSQRVLSEAATKVEEFCAEAQQAADDEAASETVLIGLLQRLIEQAHLVLGEQQEWQVLIGRLESRSAGGKCESPVCETTGLPSRLAIDALLDQWGELVQEEPVLVAALGIDDFSKCNASYGTRVCDLVLRAVGTKTETLCSSEAGVECIARLRGDRIGLLLRGMDMSAAVHLMERLRRQFEASHMQHGGMKIALTVSCGLVTITDSLDPVDVHARLDQILTATKEDGGNKTMVDDGNGPEGIVPDESPAEGGAIPIG